MKTRTNALMCQKNNAVTKKEYRDSVVNFRRGVHKAKNIWVQRLMTTFERNMDDGNGHDSPWDIVKEIRKGLSKVKKSEKVMMQMSEGIYAKNISGKFTSVQKASGKTF